MLKQYVLMRVYVTWKCTVNIEEKYFQHVYTPELATQYSTQKRPYRTIKRAWHQCGRSHNYTVRPHFWLLCTALYAFVHRQCRRFHATRVKKKLGSLGLDTKECVKNYIYYTNPTQTYILTSRTR